MVKEYLREYGFGEEYIANSSFNFQNIQQEKKALVRIKKRLSFFEEDGFSRKSIIKIFSGDSALIFRRISTNAKKITFFKDLGLTDEEIKKLTIGYPKIFSIGEGKLRRRMAALINFKLDAIGLLLTKSNIFLTGEDSFFEILMWLKTWWTEEEIARILAKAPTILTLSKENLEDKMSWFLEFGFTRSETAKIILNCPSLLTMKKERYQKRVDFLGGYGFNKDEIMSIVLAFPSIIALKEDTLGEKFDLMSEYGLRNTIIKNPLRLMYSCKLLRARIAFLKSRELVPISDHISSLFLSQVIFEKVFKISKKELLEKYREKQIGGEK